ncbi:MAG TPA: AAA family ATPase [Methylomirabilota bacterium]|jgi:SpoVK/Ycf46/Vps4 family AAA+-type ATPase|nr:AAA family ATPase [Methylomirabilota bacterium]
MDVLKDLELLVLSRYPIIAVETYEEERVEAALQSVAAKLQIPFFVWTVTEGLRRHGADSVIYGTQPPLAALANLAAFKGDGLYLFKDLHRYLGDAEVVRKLRDLTRPFGQARRALFFAAPRIELPAELEKLVAGFRLELPTREELRQLAERVVAELSQQHRIKVEVTPADFDRLIDALKGLTVFEVERSLTKVVLDDMALTIRDLDRLLEIKRRLLERQGVLEYVPTEDGLGAVGGLGHLKEWLAKRKRAFTPEAGRFGIAPPKGVLLLGVQGAGKSLAARAVAREWGLPLLRLEPVRLYDKYVGESEKNLEQALAMAERMAPCVLMVDEIEKGFAAMGSSDSDAGLSRRILGRLLGWLQDRAAPVFVVATCNQIADLPPELMRKGRFDEIFFLDLPTPAERREIFAIHLRKRKRDPAAFDLDALAAAADGFSGAEIEAAVVAALYTAFAAGSELGTALILDELRATRPLSVTRAEDITALRDWARDRAVPAN